MQNKYELDKQTGALVLDRILYTSTHYPQNYGFIPRTYAGDNDPLDVLVICSEPIVPLALVQCYPIGIINMVDSGLEDEKSSLYALTTQFTGSSVRLKNYLIISLMKFVTFLKCIKA